MDFILERDPAASKLMELILSCKYFVLISSLVVQEMVFQGLGTEIDTFILILRGKNKIDVKKIAPEDVQEAKNILALHRTHYNDALHKVIAKRYGASLFVTRNIKDFITFTDITIKKPDAL